MEPEISFNSLIDRAALGYLKSKKLLPGFSHYDVWMQEHAVAFTVAKMMDKDLLADVQTALAAAIENGTVFADFKRQLKPYLMSKGWWGEQIMLDPVDGMAKLVQLGSTRRLKTIFDTNLATAHAAGQWSRIQKVKKALPYLKYIPSTAANKRDGHKRYYNLILTVDDPLWSEIYPPNGYGCQCSVRQLTLKQALREREADIMDDPDAFTDEQKAASEAGRLNDKPRVEYINATNPRTGKTVRVPADITPTFAHNHGDRVAALEALFGDGHGADALDKMIAGREAYLADKLAPPPLMVTVLKNSVIKKSEITRLTKGGSNVVREHEALAAAQWQATFNVRLEPFADDVKNPPDFYITETGKPRSAWQTLDWMFTEDAENQYKIAKMNQYFGGDAWPDKIRQIEKHLEKADIVPMDLRYLNAENRAMLIAYVLSLPEEKLNKIKLVVGESK